MLTGIKPEWDYENRMSGVQHPDGTIETFTYLLEQERRIESGMGKGLRHSVENSAGKRYMVWDDQNLLQERDGSGSLIAQYTGRPNDYRSLVSQRRGSQTLFAVGDQQGSVRQWYATDETLAGTFDFSTFGTLIGNTGSVVTPCGYCGEFGYYSNTSEQLYVRARELDCTTGCWLAVDPLVLSFADRNLFQYAYNNPITLKDPSGMDPPPPNATEKIIKDIAEKVKIYSQYTVGSRPPEWNPIFWRCRFIGSNCYAYAFDVPETEQGVWNLNNIVAGAKSDKEACDRVLNDAISRHHAVPPVGGKCGKTYHMVQAYWSSFETTARPDSHWYRQDVSGQWSSKPGGGPAQQFARGTRRGIYEPTRMTPYQRLGYDCFCGALCAPNTNLVPARVDPPRGPKYKAFLMELDASLIGCEQRFKHVRPKR